MTPGRIACAFAILAALCVLSIFFFPGVEGPYPAVHGPVTALLSLRAAARLRLIIRAGINAVRRSVSSATSSSSLLIRESDSDIDQMFISSACSGCIAVLRC